MTIIVAAADRRHFAALRRIEVAAFETLHAVGAVVGAAVASTDEELQAYLDGDLLLAAFDEAGVPIGLVGGSVAEEWLHIGEIDVHPDRQREGVGRRLMDALLEEGRRRGLCGATLTTDRFAPFNAPFYASLGFRATEAEACTARLAALLDAEAAKGLDPHRRVAMTLVF